MSVETTIPDIKLKSLTAFQNQHKLKNVDRSKKRYLSPEKKDDKMMKACQDFETIFVSYLLKTMRTSSIEDSGLWGNGVGEGLYRDLFETEVARKISSGGGIGLANMLYQNLAKYIKMNEGELEKTVNNKSSITLSSVNYTFKKVQTFHEYIEAAVDKYGLDPALLYAVISQESGGNPMVVSSKGAKGLMQLMDGTAKEVGVKNSFNAKENILGGTHYLKNMLERFNGNIRLALAAYNAGPNAVERYEGIPPYKETQNYVDRVLEYYNYYKDIFTKGNRRLI